MLGKSSVLASSRLQYVLCTLVKGWFRRSNVAPRGICGSETNQWLVRKCLGWSIGMVQHEPGSIPNEMRSVNYQLGRTNILDTRAHICGLEKVLRLLCLYSWGLNSY